MKQKNYPLKSAIRNMVRDVPVCYSTWKISQVKKMLFDKIKKMDTINYIYVISKDKKLVGVFSIKEIFRRKGTVKVDLIMQKEIVKVRPNTDQERVAILALNNNLKAIPVVDKDDKFLGVVPSDIILSILEAENVEDFLKIAGINSPLKKLLNGSAWYLFKVRIPWLILGLFGGIIGATIITYFEGPLKGNFILASFIPLILYMSGAVGNQTEILFIRNSVVDSQINIGEYFLKELKSSFFVGVILSFLLFLISVVLFGASYQIGIILSSSLFIGIFVSVFVGVLMPYFFKVIGKDPAIGSGPFSTILRDILSLVIYFSITTTLLTLVEVL